MSHSKAHTLWQKRLENSLIWRKSNCDWVISKRNTSSSFLGIGYSKATSISSSLTNSPIVTSLQSQAALTSGSGANTLLQGTAVNAVGGATFRAGVGDTARADARIVLEGVKTTVQTAQTRESNYVLPKNYRTIAKIRPAVGTQFITRFHVKIIA